MNVYIPEMDAVTIDNSFTHQTVWDMIQKEAMVELYWIKFDEEGNLKLLLDEVKSDIELYPSPDWTYTENRITRLGYKNGRVNINKIIVLGKTVPFTFYEGHFTRADNIFQKEWAFDEATTWDTTVGNYHLTISQTGTYSDYDTYRVRIDRTEYGVTFQTSASGSGSVFLREASILVGENYSTIYMHRRKDGAGKLKEGTATITVGSGDYSVTHDTRYDQISASVTDPNSIVKYR